MRLSFSRRCAAVSAAVGVVLALTLPNSAAAASTGPTSGPTDHVATDTEEHLRTALGTAFGGAWLAADGEQWVVAVTDPALAGQVVAAGAQPRLVQHSESQLAAVQDELDRTEPPSASVAGWYVDVQANSVVVEVLPDGYAAAMEFIEASGVDPAAVRITEVAQAPQPLRSAAAVDAPQSLQPTETVAARQPAWYPLREGDPIYVNGTARCTIAALVYTASDALGYLTAGHCGTVGTPVSGFNGQPQGVFQGSVFPGRGDYGLVIVNSSWFPTPRQWPAGQSTLLDPPIGTTVCKAGSTTGWTCGRITAKNQTVNYPQGAVYGLTRTTLCAEPGDSGAPVYVGRYPYGLISGGSGNCRTGGVTFVQPIAPVLAAWNLRLIMH